MNFLDRVLRGEEFDDAIDDYVDTWHDGDFECSLHEFLGFTKQEYALWVEDPRCLQSILLMRKHGQSLSSDEWGEVHLLAARSQGPQDKAALKEWLASKGLI